MWLDQWRPKYAKLYVTDLVITFKTNQVKLQTNPSLVILATPVLPTVNTPPSAVVIAEETLALLQPTASTAIHLLAMPSMPARPLDGTSPLPRSLTCLQFLSFIFPLR
jgi:hypothetical protein